MMLSANIGLILVYIVGLYECREQIIYVADGGHDRADGQIVRVDLGNMNFTVLNLTTFFPDVIDCDEHEEQIYWTDLSFQTIMRAGPFGENLIVFEQLRGDSVPSGLAIDSTSRLLFYADFGLGEICAIGMDSFKRTVLVKSGQIKPIGLVVHTIQRKLYWIDYTSDPKIKSCDYDGNSIGLVADTEIVKPYGLALDQRANLLYWTDETYIKSISTDGTNISTVYEETGVIFNKISVFNGYIYATIINNTFLFSMPIDGNHLSVVETANFTTPNGIHAFSPAHFNQTICDTRTYGNSCEECGHCIGGAECDEVTGVCPEECADGWRGERCDEACGYYTYGTPCKDCGRCRRGVSCDEVTGVCPNGCEDGWKGERCDKEKEVEAFHLSVNHGSVTIPLPVLGIVLGVAFMLILAMAGMFIYCRSLKRQKSVSPVSKFPDVKKSRSNPKEQTQGPYIP